MFSPDGNRVPHPGWLHYDFDFDDETTIACQSCPQHFDRQEAMSALLAHIMIVHNSNDCYSFKKSTGFFGHERVLLKLDKHHPGWKYFEALNESSVACRMCKKAQVNVDVGRLLKHLQRAHPLSNFTDFRGAVFDLDGDSNGINVRQVKREKREPVPEDGGGTLPVANNNNSVDDKSQIVRIVSGEATSSTALPSIAATAALSTPLVGFVALPQSQIPSDPIAPSNSTLPSAESATLPQPPSIRTTLQDDAALPLNEGAAVPPTSPLHRTSESNSESSESSEDSDVSEYNPNRPTAANTKGTLTESGFHLHTVTDRMTRKWHYQKKLPLSAFKKPKDLVFYRSYWTNGCQKRYFKCGQQSVRCPYRMLAVNNKDWIKLFRYRHHSHPVNESSSSSSSESAPSSSQSSSSG
uniref:BED-type domain-containing protein n=1 Tax=Panagrellus redivivus TaxID=6233 RepID=A0A7E5A0D6_PANRE